MSTLYILLNHTLTEEQRINARKQLKVHSFVEPPEEISKIWSSVEPEGELNLERLNKVVDWLSQNTRSGDFVLVQGEYGATYYVVNYCFQQELVPVYATSKRVYEEKVLEDGSVERRHLFKHVNFRIYRRWQK